MLGAPGVEIKGARRDTESLLERAREIGGGCEAAGERNLREGGRSISSHERDGPVEALALHEVGECFAHDDLKNPVEMKGREVCCTCNRGQSQGLIKPGHDVVDGAVDAIGVGERGRPARFGCSSQDL